jgi:predicted small metal-binding protein
MGLVLECDCGFVARGEDEDRLVAAVCLHAREAHGMALSREEALVLIRPAPATRAATGQPTREQS